MTAVREQSLADTSRHFAVAMHLSPFSVLLFGPIFLLTPLVLWLIRKDQSTFEDDHGREVMNFGLSMLLFTLLLCWTILVPLALLVITAVNLIRGAVAAGRGEYFRYPLTIRFLS